MSLKQFKILEQIGSGASGKVYLIERNGTRKRYVMKTIHLIRIPVPDRLSCVAEIQVLSRLNHPFIVQYRESFVENMSLHIVMEFCEGGDLYTLIRRHAKESMHFEESTILRWLAQALVALKFIHERHILHRDIKSLNFFLDKDQRLRLGDFGVSKILENTLAYAQTWVGTPYYLSPELCRGSPYAWPSDIWSLGCVIYEVATFKTPFANAKNIQKLLEKIQRCKVPAFPSRYSKELKMIVFSMLRKNPEKRPSASDLMKTKILQETVKCLIAENTPPPTVAEASTIALDVQKVLAVPKTFYGAPTTVRAEKRIATLKLNGNVITAIKTIRKKRRNVSLQQKKRNSTNKIRSKSTKKNNALLSGSANKITLVAKNAKRKVTRSAKTSKKEAKQAVPVAHKRVPVKNEPSKVSKRRQKQPGTLEIKQKMILSETKQKKDGLSVAPAKKATSAKPKRTASQNAAQVHSEAKKLKPKVSPVTDGKQQTSRLRHKQKISAKTKTPLKLRNNKLRKLVSSKTNYKRATSRRIEKSKIPLCCLKECVRDSRKGL